MKRMNSSFAFMVSLLLLIGGLVIGAFSFFSGMNANHVLIQQGLQPTKQILNHYKYMQNKRGLIYSVTFLTMGLSFFIMVVLPSEEKPARVKPAPVPEPVRPEREGSDISAVVEQSAAEEKPEEAEAIAPPSKEEAPAAAQIETIEGDEAIQADAVEEVKEGEDDVVYGSGPITDAAIIHFVHKYPDSALKFLFRRQLDGKALTGTEEEIYQGWEQRQMTRGKVKSYIMTLMNWKEFPKRPLYELWKEIRDHIFENVMM